MLSMSEYPVHFFYIFFFSLKMNIGPTAKSSSPLTGELDVTNTISTLPLFDDSIFNAALNPLNVHLEKDSVEQNVLDRCLVSAFQIVQKKDREMSQVAPTLQLLLQHGARWKDGVLLGHDMTSCHLICQSTGDHHELLDWLLKSSDRTLINTKDSDGSTALFYAVQKENINCVRTLIANRADVNIGGPRWYAANNWNSLSPIIVAIERHSDSKQSSTIMPDIIDLLLDNGVDINKSMTGGEQYTLIDFAIDVGNVECVKKLIRKGAKLNVFSDRYRYVWARAAILGSVELVKCILNHGIDKDSKDQDGQSLLTRVVYSRDVEAVRYLLNLGVTVNSYEPKVELDPCQKCGTNRLILRNDCGKGTDGSCYMAIYKDNPEIIQMLVEHGSQSCQSFAALVSAVRACSLNVVEYLLNKYSYPLNVTYSVTAHRWRSYHSLLTEYCYRNTIKITKLLLEHGADPNIKICVEKHSSVLFLAIKHKHEEVIALYIRNGVDVDYRSFDGQYGMVLPFEASVLHDRLHVTETSLLLHVECSAWTTIRR